MEAFIGTQDRFLDDFNHIALCEMQNTIRHFSTTDFRSLGVQHDGQVITCHITDFTDHLDPLAMVFMVAVREIETNDVHANFSEFLNHFRGFSRRAQCTYNFSFTNFFHS